MIPIEYPDESNNEDLNEQRQKYGVSKVDVWWFDGYMLTVMRNGLELLVEELHGWLVCKEFPTFESWKDELQRVISLIDFCLRDEHSKIYDSINWSSKDDTISWLDHPEIDENGLEYYSFKEEHQTDNDRLYSRLCKEHDEKVRQIEKEIWLWFGKWWHALWD